MSEGWLAGCLYDVLTVKETVKLLRRSTAGWHGSIVVVMIYEQDGSKPCREKAQTRE